MGTHLSDQGTYEEADNALSPAGKSAASDGPGDIEQARQLGTWIHALRSFFNVHNHPFSQLNQTNLITHDWAGEMRIVRGTLLLCSQLVFELVHSSLAENAVFAGPGESDALGVLSADEARAEDTVEASDDSLFVLAAALNDALVLCESLLELREVDINAWASFGKVLERELGNVKALAADAHRRASRIPAPLLALVRERAAPAALAADMSSIFSSLFGLLECLRLIEAFLRADQPLKQTLPLFTLVHQESRALIRHIETRTLHIEGLDHDVFDMLDGTNYALSMELRKVFASELGSVSSLRQAYTIYGKVEAAHGLLRDSFQQSVIGLAQLFNPALDGPQLFSSFQTKLEQSLSLRRDLWLLLQLVKRAEEERDLFPMARLLERLASFRDGSLRYLMFKDWEACERFIEEVAAARGAVELAPVLHRFAAYLETLGGQVNMRAVLAAHPFDHPPLETP
jgi:hypothetical protein